jgi:protein-disulfide isomerase
MRQGRMVPFLIVLLLIAAAGATLLYTQVRASRAEAREAPIAIDVSAAERVAAATLGRADAPRTLVEVADYQCAGCAHFAETRLPRIKAELVETGQVRYLYVEFPLRHHEHAVAAARAARCAGEHGAYWPFHERLFAGRAEWAPAPAVDAGFATYAADLGIDSATFSECLASTRHLASVEAARAFSEGSRIRGTPSLFLDGLQVPDPFDVDALIRDVHKATGVP